MLKEMVGLIEVASGVYNLSTVENGEAGYSLPKDLDEEIRAAIDNAKDAIGRHDEQKRKTDEAICLLFRAVHESTSCIEEADVLVQRAERLLGFASLEPAKS